MNKLLSLTLLLALMLGIFSTGHAVVVTVGTGYYQQQYPFHHYHGYGRSLGLYTAAQIGRFGKIYALGWNVSRSGSYYHPYKIYIKSTTATQLTPMTWADFTSGATLVKVGNHVFNNSGLHTFELDTPFYYIGDNLLIGVETNYGGSGTLVSVPRFYNTSGITASHQYWTQNHSAPTGNGTVEAVRPNLSLYLTSIPSDPVFELEPTGWNIGHRVINSTISKTFTITSAGSGTINVTGISPMSDGFFTVTDATAFPVTLTTGQTATFKIKYTPTVVGNHAATFTISHTNGTTAIPVSGECYDPTITSFPYLQNFDETWSGSPAAPYGWEVIDANNDGKTWRQSNSHIAPTHSPPYAAYGEESTDDWLIAPPIDLSSTYARLKWWDKVGLASRPNSYKVLVSTTTSDTTSFVELADIVCTNTGWTQHKLNLDAYIGQTIHLAFHQYASAYYNGLGIDDVLLEEISTTPVFIYTPADMEFGPSRINTVTPYQNVTVTNDGIGILNLSATDVSIIGPDAAMFTLDSSSLPLALSFDQSGNIPVRYNPTAIGLHNATLRMVYAGTNHDVALSGVAVDEFALLESFEDPTFPPPGWSVHNGGNDGTWGRIFFLPRTGEYHAAVDIDWGGTRNDWLITPKLTPTAADRIFGFYACNETPNTEERFNVLLSTTTPDIASFTHTLATNVLSNSGEYKRHIYDLSSYIGQNVYIAIQAISTCYGGCLCIDDVFGQNIVPDGSSGLEIEVTISGSNVVLEWEAVPEATGYKVYASEDPYNFGPDPVATVNTNSVTLPATASKRFFRVTSVTGE